MRPEHGRDGQFDFDAVDFVTSDHHFGHARISELAGRPFSTVDEMNTVLIERWNALVKPDDVVLHLGDLALGPIEQSVALTSQLNGTRLLVPGNHDHITGDAVAARDRAVPPDVSGCRVDDPARDLGWVPPWHPTRCISLPVHG